MKKKNKIKKIRKKTNIQQEKKASIEEVHIVGTFQKNQNFGFVVPDHKSYETDIFIPKSKFNKAKNNQKVVVKINKKEERGRKAEGEIIEILGSLNKSGVDMISLIKEHNLPYEFPIQVIKEAKKCGTTIDEKEIKNRVDLRENVIFTIDGEDAKDLDDAVGIKKLENGNYKLDVHIADVSFYVKEGSFLDSEAQIRGTSVYMLNTVIPMLPKELSNGICSLNQGEDRFAITCSMEINNKGKVVSNEVFKSVIRVTRRMNYKNVQKILDKSKNSVLEEYKDFIKDFELMEELAKILKKRRIKQGYLNLDIPETKIELDKKRKTNKYWKI